MENGNEGVQEEMMIEQENALKFSCHTIAIFIRNKIVTRRDLLRCREEEKDETKELGKLASPVQKICRTAMRQLSLP